MMLTNIALYYYLIYTPLQFWPCETKTHAAVRSFGTAEHGATAAVFHQKGKAVFEISHLDSFAQYSLLAGIPINLTKRITIESSLGLRFTRLGNFASYFDPVVHSTAAYTPDKQSMLRVTTGYDRGQFIARIEQHYFFSKEWSITAGWWRDHRVPAELYGQVSFIHDTIGAFWIQQGAYTALGFSWIKEHFSISVVFGNTMLLAHSTVHYVP